MLRRWRTKARRGRRFGWRQRLLWRDGVAPPLLLATLQFFFCQHRKVEQALYRMIFFIINNVLNVTPQPPIKPNDLILLVLNYPTTYHTLLQLLVIFLHRHVSLIKTLQFLKKVTSIGRGNKPSSHLFFLSRPCLWGSSCTNKFIPLNNSKVFELTSSLSNPMLLRNKIGTKFLFYSHLPIYVGLCIISAIERWNRKLYLSIRIVIVISNSGNLDAGSCSLW